MAIAAVRPACCHVVGFPVILYPRSPSCFVLAPHPSLTQLLFSQGFENLPWKLLKAVIRGGYTESVPPCTSYISVRPRSRIHVLAEPKPVFCESSPRLAWGDQETIWTLSWGALTARPSARILSLSKPKTDFSKYKYRCRPVIGGRSLLAKFGYPSERLLRLAEPKKYLPAYLEKRARESPEWPVSLAARNYNASQRILELARPKGLHPDFVPAREVSRLPQKAIASPRTIELSKPRQLHAKYAPPRDPEWPVTETAKHAVATPRVLELAQPNTRPRMGLTTLNPDAFRVKEAAMKAVCSPRLQELARPIQR